MTQEQKIIKKAALECVSPLKGSARADFVILKISVATLHRAGELIAVRPKA